MMAVVTTGAFALWLMVACSAKPASEPTQDIQLRMPDVQPTVKDTYVCLPMKMAQDPTYLTGFVPHANMTTAHHILLFGCEQPGNTDQVWNCGEMESSPTVQTSPPCLSEPKIIYAWAMDAPELKLPKGVAFKVGGDTSIQWLVLQVHYKDVTHFLPPENGKDDSGLTIHSTKKAQPMRAGVYLLSTGGQIPAHSTTYMEAACSIDDQTPIHPFAFRVHAHKHGEVVSGYRVRDGQWAEIGRKSPKQPQMFYDVANPDMTFKKGDILAARCTMVNDEDRTVTVGPTQKDEMCNFYVMYWMPGDETMEETYCTTAGPPAWYWNSVHSIHVENLPGDASRVPGTDTVLEASAIQQHIDNVMQDAEHSMENDWRQMVNEADDLEEDSFPFRGAPGFGGFESESLRDLMYRVAEEDEERNSNRLGRWYPGQMDPYEEEDERLYYPRY